MKIVEVPGMRSRVSTGPEGMTFSIPSKKNIFLILFLAAWLVGWGFGFYATGRALLLGEFKAGGEKIFLLIWLVFWTIGGTLAIYIWLWNVMGKELITLNSDTLIIKRDIGGYGRVHAYSLQHVKNLRVSPLGFNLCDFRTSLQFWGIGGGNVAFDYGARTYRFGASVDEAEANMIIQKMKERHAAL